MSVQKPESSLHVKRSQHFENASDELWSSLDVLCEVVNHTCTWMEEALIELGDKSDGGNALHKELFQKLCDARDTLQKWEADPVKEETQCE